MQNKRYLLPVIAAAALMIFGAVLWFSCVQPVRERMVIVTEDPDDMSSFTRLSEGDELRQTFRTEEAFERMYYYVGSFGLKEQPGTMRAELYAKTSGELLRSIDIDLAQTEDSWFNELDMSGIAYAADGLYEAVFTVTSLGAGSEYAFCETAHDISAVGSRAVINGQEDPFSLYIYCARMKDMGVVRVFFIVMTLLLTAVLLLSGLLLKRMGRIAWFAATALTLGLLMTFAIPYNTIHDIEVHTVNTFVRATGLMHGRLEMSSETRQTVRASESRGHTRYYVVGPDQYYYYLTETFEPVDRTLVNVVTRAPGEGQFFENLPQITGTLVSRALGLGRYLTIHLNETLQLMFYVLLGCLALHFAPVPDMLAMVFLFPVALRSGGSFSYDGFIIPMGLLLLALMLQVILRKERVSRGRMAAMFILSLLLAPHRMIYVPMGLLLLASPDENWGGRRNKWLYTLGMVTISGIAALAGQWAYITQKLGETGVVKGWEDRDVYSYSFFIEQPVEALTMLIRSIVVLFPTMLGESVSGLYNYQLPDLLAVPLFFLTALAVPKKEADRVKPALRAWGPVVALMVIGLGYIAHIRQTTVGDPLIWAHGKYFIPILPAIPLAITGLMKKRPDGRLLVWLTAAVDCFFCVWFMASAIAK